MLAPTFGRCERPFWRHPLEGVPAGAGGEGGSGENPLPRTPSPVWARPASRQSFSEAKGRA